MKEYNHEKIHLWKEEPSWTNLTKKEVRINKILAILFEENGLTAYDIRKKFKKITQKKIPHSTLYDILKLLLSDKSIEIIETKPFRTKIDKKIYDITFRGVRRLLCLSIWRNEEKNMDLKFVTDTLLSKEHLHPVLKKIKEWKLTETPQLLKTTLFSEDIGLFHYVTWVEDESCPFRPVESVTEDFVKMLTCYFFRDELGELNAEPFVGFLIEWTSLAENPPPEEEIMLFLNNNKWMYQLIKDQIEDHLRFYEQSYFMFKKAYDKHIGFFKEKLIQ